MKVAIHLIALLLTINLLGTTQAVLSQTPAPDHMESTSPDPYANETKEQRDARMAWWREARFGMFIHWGVYAVPAGTYNDEKIDGIGEWIMLRGEIPVAEYKAYAKEFNPVHYDPGYWAKLAKKAGMRYMVITSKHHDGFALFPSDATDWDIADATPYGKDLIGPLAEAARAEGLKFGLYYSQAQDWTHPGGSKARHKEGEGWDDAHLGDFDQYLKEIAYPQVKEILTRYQPDILWWDTPIWMNKERADKLLPLITIVPGIITNNRLGGKYKGDTDTPEQHIPAKGFDDRDWEVCMTMNDTWGYKSYDDNWKTTEDLIQKLCDIASKGGNFLLNIGPKPDGTIPQPSIDRLEEIGAWMDINSDSIYGTTASPFHRLTWGRCTKKIHPDGVTLYLHVFDWPQDGNLVVPGLNNMPDSITLLQDGSTLKAKPVTGAQQGLQIEVPAQAPDSSVSVIKLKIDGDLDIDTLLPQPAADGIITLTPAFADIHNKLGTDAKLQTNGGQTYIGNWTKSRAWVGWTFESTQPGKFEVLAEIASEKASSGNLSLDGKDTGKAELAASGANDQFQQQSLGTIEITTTGVHTLEIKPDKDNWHPINLRQVQLKPVK